jgi:hypothetical protein
MKCALRNVQIILIREDEENILSHDFHYIYKTTCYVTKKFYYGMHSTNDLNDGYFGSGLLLLKSISKYGKENHHVKIIQFFKSRHDLHNAEKQLITAALIEHPLCMNLIEGGIGGFNHEYLVKPKSDATKEKMRIAARKRAIESAGIKRSNQTRAKIKIANIGSKNPHFRKSYIYSLQEKRSISVPKEELQQWLDLGWIKGRKIKFD